MAMLQMEKKKKVKKKNEAQKQGSDSDSDVARITSAVDEMMIVIDTEMKVMRIVPVPLLSRSL